MLGLVNAIGTDSVRKVAPVQVDVEAQHGIKVPIPIAQRESKAEAPQSAVQAMGHEDEAPASMGRPLPDGEHEVENELTQKSIGSRVDMMA